MFWGSLFPQSLTCKHQVERMLIIRIFSLWPWICFQMVSLEEHSICTINSLCYGADCLCPAQLYPIKLRWSYPRTWAVDCSDHVGWDQVFLVWFLTLRSNLSAQMGLYPLIKIKLLSQRGGTLGHTCSVSLLSYKME